MVDPQRHASFLEDIDRKVETFGHAVMYIFPTEDSEPGETSFSYTVGLAEKNWPEMIVQALPAEIAATILNDLVKLCQERGCPPVVGEVIGGIANFPLGVAEVSREQVLENFGVALRRAERQNSGEVRAIQLVLSDRAGVLPGQEGYDHAHMDSYQKPLSGTGWPRFGRDRALH